MRSTRQLIFETLATLLLLPLFSGASKIAPAQRANLRPRVPDQNYSSLSRRALSKLNQRASSNTCGDGSGQAVNISTLVSDAVSAGLPSASDTGVLFMKVTVATTDMCGPYSCYVSPDATGASWTSMNLLTDVPSVTKACGPSSTGATDYSLVAQIPSGTLCSGPSGACLVMCKNSAQTLGSCAAVMYDTQASTSSASTSSAESTSESTASSSTNPETTADSESIDASSAEPVTYTVISSIDVTRSQTIVVTTASTPSSTSSAKSTTSSSSTTNQPIATIVGFSGDNSPGGLSDSAGGALSAAALGSNKSQIGAGSARLDNGKAVYTLFASACFLAALA